MSLREMKDKLFSGLRPMSGDLSMRRDMTPILSLHIVDQ